MLELSKKRRRALSTASVLDSAFHSIQFFNPEFDPSSGYFFVSNSCLEEEEPKGIRSILHQRFLEALDASVIDDKKEIVLVLDKVVFLLRYNIAWTSNDESVNSK